MNNLIQKIQKFLIFIIFPGLVVIQSLMLQGKIINFRRRIKITKNNKLIWIGNIIKEKSIVIGDKITLLGFFDEVEMISIMGEGEIGVLENGMEISNE